MKKFQKLFFALLFLLLMVCGCKKKKEEIPVSNPVIVTSNTPILKYYYGDVITTSPDGLIQYGSAVQSLVKRTIKSDTIIEKVKQDTVVYNTTLISINHSLVFNASDLLSTFLGTVTFSGNSWLANTWQYDITMTDGSGKIVGDGKITSTGIQTKKYFLDSAGVQQVRITENLNEITETQYNQLY